MRIYFNLVSVFPLLIDFSAVSAPIFYVAIAFIAIHLAVNYAEIAEFPVVLAVIEPVVISLLGIALDLTEPNFAETLAIESNLIQSFGTETVVTE